jgi:hypothetical protein
MSTFGRFLPVVKGDYRPEADVRERLLSAKSSH